MPVRNYLGFDRKLKLKWMDAAAELASQPPAEAKATLEAFLSTDVKGKDARRKANDALRRLWVTCERNRLTAEAQRLFRNATPDGRVALHYGMSLMAAPFFRDAVHFIGRLIRLQGKVGVAAVRTRIYERWGERSTLNSVTARVFASLEDWGILKSLGRGNYEANELVITEAPLGSWLLAAALHAHQSKRLPPDELVALPELFPFEIDNGSQLVRAGQYFALHRQGLDRTYVHVEL